MNIAIVGTGYVGLFQGHVSLKWESMLHVLTLIVRK